METKVHLTQWSMASNRGASDLIIFGRNSSERLKAACKLVSGFKDPIDNAYIYEVGYNGKMIAQYDKTLKRFLMCDSQN
jgi:hypothetical protein